MGFAVTGVYMHILYRNVYCHRLHRILYRIIILISLFSRRDMPKFVTKHGLGECRGVPTDLVIQRDLLIKDP